MKKNLISLIVLYFGVFSLYAQNATNKTLNWKIGDKATYQVVQTLRQGGEEQKNELKMEMTVLQTTQDGYQLQAIFSLLVNPEIEVKADDFGKKIMELMKDFVVIYQVNKQGAEASLFQADQSFVTKEEQFEVMKKTAKDDGEKFTVALFHDLMQKEKILPKFVEILKNYHNLYRVDCTIKQKITKTDSLLVNYRTSKSITLPAVSVTETNPRATNQNTVITNTITLTDFTLSSSW